MWMWRNGLAGARVSTLGLLRLETRERERESTYWLIDISKIHHFTHIKLRTCKVFHFSVNFAMAIKIKAKWRKSCRQNFCSLEIKREMLLFVTWNESTWISLTYFLPIAFECVRLEFHLGLQKTTEDVIFWHHSISIAIDFVRFQKQV